MSMMSDLVEKLRWIADYEYQNRNSEVIIRQAADVIEMLSEKARVAEQEWIPCSERLPREYKTVLVTWKYAGKFYTATAFRETKNAVTYWASDGQPHYTPLNVVAWMPLPEPWKGEDDE